ncbi:MAG TPA: amino acid transporter [Dehalococcoidia bacterium]|nr:amino acid transporter [Dehalococcoidia bacterium]
MSSEQGPPPATSRGYLRRGSKPGTSVFVVPRHNGVAPPEPEASVNGRHASPRAAAPLPAPAIRRQPTVATIPGYHAAPSEEHAPHTRHFWLFVLCLTGVDYFSTLAYQPGIAFNATGFLSPIATAVLVAFTLAGALTVYRVVARESSNGQGSISMLERLLPRWWSKLLVLVLLGFAATDFIITITLSAADAAKHFVENHFVAQHTPAAFQHQFAVTLVLLGLLGLVFWRGFGEAIKLAIVLVSVYLVLNTITIAAALEHIARHPGVVNAWRHGLTAEYGNPLAMVREALVKFPALALGLSGFETGVAVMPLVIGRASDTGANPAGRIANTRKLLTTAALVMSAFLITSSIVTSLLIPPAAFAKGGAAEGRALSYLSHIYLGNIYGTGYDLSTMLILWFAGASAMAGLLNLVPRYLPRYGLAPGWTAAQRPLVVVFTAIAVVVTVVFAADVEAQGGAYATGVLVLMMSASVAVAIAAHRMRSRIWWAYALIVAAFIYITAQNVRERPDGIKIASIFIIAIVGVSLVSRVLRSTELRIQEVELDAEAQQLVEQAIAVDGHGHRRLHLMLHKPGNGDDVAEYAHTERRQRRVHYFPPGEPILVVQMETHDPSAFADRMVVHGRRVGPYSVLRCSAPAVPNGIVALSLVLVKQYRCQVHLNGSWTSGSPVARAVRFIIFGEGDTARLVEYIKSRVLPESEQDGIIMHVA